MGVLCVRVVPDPGRWCKAQLRTNFEIALVHTSVRRRTCRIRFWHSRTSVACAWSSVTSKIQTMRLDQPMCDTCLCCAYAGVLHLTERTFAGWDRAVASMPLCGRRLGQCVRACVVRPRTDTTWHACAPGRACVVDVNAGSYSSTDSSCTLRKRWRRRSLLTYTSLRIQV